MSGKIQTNLLNALNSLLDIKKKTIYGACKYLKKIYPNADIFEFISILSYNKGEEILKQMQNIYLGDFYQTITDFKIKAYSFFIDCVQGSSFEDNQKINEKLVELINSIVSNSFLWKYINMIRPLIDKLDQKNQLKMKLYIMIPNAYNIFYLDISKEFPLFPKNAIDFYSYSNIKANTENIIEFVNNSKIKAMQIPNDVNEKIEKLKKEFNLKYEDLNLKYENLNLK